MKPTGKHAAYVRRCRQAHVKERAGERYGIALPAREQAEICALIRAGNARFLFKQSNTRSWYQVPWKGKLLNVVYGRHVHALLTVLPADAYVEEN